MIKFYFSFRPQSVKMAKKPFVRKLSNPEAYERINYLLHIATSSLLTAYKNLVLLHEAKNKDTDKNKTTRKYFTPAIIKRELAEVVGIVQGYVKTLREVAKKSVIRL